MALSQNVQIRLYASPSGSDVDPENTIPDVFVNDMLSAGPVRLTCGIRSMVTVSVGQ